MDRVRFGRALGYGARHAAKTLAQAVDAASAPNPGGSRVQAAAPRGPASEGPGVGNVRARTSSAQASVEAVRRQAKGSFIAPIARFSGTLWLQVTGVFFALVAMAMGGAAWRARAAFYAPHGSHAAVKLYTYLAVFVVFAYFAVSSFVRAQRR